MGYRVLLRRTADNVERWSRWYEYSDDDATNPGLIAFSWYENNFACDCNRHLEFERAAGRDEDSLWDDDVECGETAYEVLRIENDDGAVLVDDDVPHWALALPAAKPRNSTTSV